MCKEFLSPTRTVHKACEEQAHKYLWSSIPDLWQDDIVIWCAVDTVRDKLCIDMELLGKGIGIAYEIDDITRLKMAGEEATIMGQLAYVASEFGQRAFIRMLTPKIEY